MADHLGIRAPFPWFGGKSRAAELVWAALGDVQTYVEPFAGSLAVLLARPTEPRIETVNDRDCYLANFWRAIAADPEGVAVHCDWPVNEADLHARHAWLRAQADFRERMLSDSEYFDAKVAGWWVWGVSQWIGGGWCDVEGRSRAARQGALAQGKMRVDGWKHGAGVLGLASRQIPLVRGLGNGGHRKRPNVAGYYQGKGTHRVGGRRPDCTGQNHGRGIHQLPNVDGFGDKSVSGSRAPHLIAWFEKLASRLRRVRVCCGDWTRVLTPTVVRSTSTTGILLDPPYDHALRDPDLYAHDSQGLSAEVRQWAIEHGDDPKLRIVLCGYEGEHEMPASWRCVPWLGHGGMSRGRGPNDNRAKERIWLSPACLEVGPPAQATLQLEPAP